MGDILTKYKKLPLTMKLAAIPFGICAIFLLLLGKILGLTYKQISVIFNLWLQGTVLLLSAAVPLGACIYKMVMIHKCPYSLIGLSIFFVVYLVIYLWVIRKVFKHYTSNMDYAFKSCVADLKQIASKWNVSYWTVNLMIFILFYLMLIMINVMLGDYILLLSTK